MFSFRPPASAAGAVSRIAAGPAHAAADLVFTTMLMVFPTVAAAETAAPLAVAQVAAAAPGFDSLNRQFDYLF